MISGDGSDGPIYPHPLLWKAMDQSIPTAKRLKLVPKLRRLGLSIPYDLTPPAQESSSNKENK